MERLISISGVSIVTASSVLLALGIEMALLKVIFRCMAHVKTRAVEPTTEVR